jgi:hypothetical protein
MSFADKQRRLRSYIVDFAKEKRLTRVTIRLTHGEKERWFEAARREGLDLSSFIRRLLSIRNGSGPKRAVLRVEDGGPPSSSRKSG